MDVFKFTQAEPGQNRTYDFCSKTQSEGTDRFQHCPYRGFHKCYQLVSKICSRVRALNLGVHQLWVLWNPIKQNQWIFAVTCYLGMTLSMLMLIRISQNNIPIAGIKATIWTTIATPIILKFTSCRATWQFEWYVNEAYVLPLRYTWMDVFKFTNKALP
jgi:hypothetical protein